MFPLYGYRFVESHQEIKSIFDRQKKKAHRKNVMQTQCIHRRAQNLTLSNTA